MHQHGAIRSLNVEVDVDNARGEVMPGASSFAHFSGRQIDVPEAIILGCMEISLLLKPSDVAIPLVDTTTLHAEATVEFALSSEPGTGRG